MPSIDTFLMGQALPRLESVQQGGGEALVPSRKCRYSAFVTWYAANAKESTQPRWAGFLSSRPASPPMQHHCSGMRTMTGSMNCASAPPSPLLLVEAAVMFLFLQAPGVDLFSYPQMPTILPESSTSIEAAREIFGRPGISIMLPAIATTKPAPAESDALFTFRVQPVGTPRLLGSWDSEYCVFAIQTDSFPYPQSENCRSLTAACSENCRWLAP